MAIDLIVQHVHSQLEEVRAARSMGGEGGSQPCLAGSCALGAQVGMDWLLLCSRHGSSCELLPALSLSPVKETAFSLCSARSWLLCQLWSSSNLLPSLGQQVMRGQTSHPSMIQGMCPHVCSPPRASIAPNLPLLLGFSSSLPWRHCCTAFSVRNPLLFCAACSSWVSNLKVLSHWSPSPGTCSITSPLLKVFSCWSWASPDQWFGTLQ